MVNASVSVSAAAVDVSQNLIVYCSDLLAAAYSVDLSSIDFDSYCYFDTIAVAAAGTDFSNSPSRYFWYYQTHPH